MKKDNVELPFNSFRECGPYADPYAGVLDQRFRRAFAQAYFERALYHFEKNRYKTALQSLNNALRMYPAHADALFLRSAVYDRRREKELALHDLTLALELNPGLGRVTSAPIL